MTKIFNKKLFLIVLVIFAGFGFSQKVQAAAALVQSASTNCASGGDCSVTISSSGSGNLIIVLIASRDDSSGITSSVTDNQSSTYSSAWNVGNLGTHYNAAVFYVVNSANGITSITVHPAASTLSTSVIVAEYSGIVTSSPYDVGSDASNSLVNSPYTSASVTTNQANELLIGYTLNINGGVPNFTGTGGWTAVREQTNSSGFHVGLQHRTVSSTGSYANTGTSDVASNFVGIATFKVASDTTAPTVTAFVIPSTASSLTVPITSFTATDAVGVTGYMLTETSGAPLAGDSGWSGSAPTTYTFSSQGEKTLYAWAKDAAGNVSTSLNDSITVNLGGGTPRYNLIITSPILTLAATEATLTWKTQESTTYELTWFDKLSYKQNKSESTESNKKDFTYTMSNLVPDNQYSYSLYIKGYRDNETRLQGEFITPKQAQIPSQTQVFVSTSTTQQPQNISTQPAIFQFTRALQYLDNGSNVKMLQTFLNKYSDTKISETGPGSPGQETDLFGTLTFKAIKRFQEKYASEILYPNNLTSGTGYVGPSTIKKINQLLQTN